MNIQTLTSQTDCIGTNQTAHIAKVLLTAGAAAALLSRLPVGGKLSIGTLGVSAIAFPAFAYTYDLIALLKEDHSPDPYNLVLNQIWGAPASTRARIQVPLVTGVQAVLLFHLLRTTQIQSWLKPVIFLAAAYPQTKALWSVLSLPPNGGDDDGSKWLVAAAAKAIERSGEGS